MLLRILLRSLLLRRNRTLTALGAIIVGAAVVSATLTLYIDVQSKLHGEFRNYGANLLVSAKPGQVLPAGALQQVEDLAGPGSMAAPFAYAVARASGGQPIVVAGTDFSRVRKLDSWWAVTNWPSQSGEALVGRRAISDQSAADFDLKYGDRSIRVHRAGSLQTGSDEDMRIYISLRDFTAWSGLSASVVELFVPGGATRVKDAASSISRAFPQTEVQPVRQIVEAEGSAFQRTRSTFLAAVLIVALTSIICLMATLTASALERRRDFALMKALGATQKTALALFAAEAAVLGTMGGIIGYGIGLGLAQWIGWRTFQAAVTPRLLLLPAILMGAIVVALAAGLLPLRMLQRLEPATVLKGE